MLSAKPSRKKKNLPRHYHVKKGDTVLVIAGKSKGTVGTIKHVFRTKGTVLVEGANMIKKAVRPDPMRGEAGGLVEMEAPLHVCKVMLYDTKNSQASRAKVSRVDGKPVRLAKKTNQQFDV